MAAKFKRVVIDFEIYEKEQIEHYTRGRIDGIQALASRIRNFCLAPPTGLLLGTRDLLTHEKFINDLLMVATGEQIGYEDLHLQKLREQICEVG